MSAPASVQQLQSWLYAQLQSLARPLQASLLQAERENTSQSLVQDAACRLDLIKLTTGALRNELWALKVFDSAGRVQPAIMSGSLFNLPGSYHQCLNYTKADGPILATKYCVAQIGADPDYGRAVAGLVGQGELRPAANYRSVNLGLCVPRSCPPADLISLANQLLRESFAGAELSCSQVHCQPAQAAARAHWSSLTIVGLSILACLLSVSLLASLAQLYSGKLVSRRLKISRQTLLAARPFSLQNGFSLLAAKPSKSARLAALDGVRVLSMLWIITMHSYSFAFQWLSFSNIGQIDNVFKTTGTQWIANGSFSVDNFLVLAGFLSTFERPLARKQRKCPAGQPDTSKLDGQTQSILKSLLARCLRRYFRLAPTLLGLIVLGQVILPALAHGPAWSKSTLMFDGWCRDNWYINLFMVHNLVRTSSMCFSHSWYLAVDFQLFALTSLVALLVAKYRIGLLKSLAVLAMASQSAVAYLVASRNLVSMPLLPARSLDALNEYFRVLYIKPHYWFASYSIGACLALRVAKHRSGPKSSRQPSGWASSCLLLACLVLMLALLSISLPYFRSSPQVMPVCQSTLYSFLARPLWSACLACLLYSVMTNCLDKPSALNNRQQPLLWRLMAAFLTRPLWLPFSRLTYSAYLLHPLVMACFYGGRSELLSFSHELLLYFTLANTVITYFCALLVYLLIEVPARFAIERISARYLTLIARPSSNCTHELARDLAAAAKSTTQAKQSRRRLMATASNQSTEF